MDFDLSPKMLAILFIIAGVVLVFILLGGSLQQLFSSSIQEIVVVKIKQNGTCIIEASDGIPRSIENCPYSQGQNLTIITSKDCPVLKDTNNRIL
jgi:hypothetical protein